MKYDKCLNSNSTEANRPTDRPTARTPLESIALPSDQPVAAPALTFALGRNRTLHRLLDAQRHRRAAGHVQLDAVRRIRRPRLLPAEQHATQALDAALPQADLFVRLGAGAAAHR